MITIDKIPGKTRTPFRPLQKHFTEPAWGHFWALVMSITISHASTIERLVKVLRGSTHRTNHGEFFWRSAWDQSWVIQATALNALKRPYSRKDRRCYFIIDDTQTLERAEKVAAESVAKAQLSSCLRATVLLDAFYLCPVLVKPCQSRKWRYISVGKSNRWFTAGSVKRKLGKYRRNVLRKSGLWCNLTGLRTIKVYQLAQRIGKLNKLGTVKIVFSRRRGEAKHSGLVTDDLKASMKTVVADYLK